MIKVSVLYPTAEGKTLDIDYYKNKHFPMVLGLLGDRVKNASIELGLSGPMPGSPPPFIAMGHLYFETLEDFQAAMGIGGQAIQDDIPNYTNAEMVIQVSEVVL